MREQNRRGALGMATRVHAGTESSPLAVRNTQPLLWQTQIRLEFVGSTAIPLMAKVSTGALMLNQRGPDAGSTRSYAARASFVRHNDCPPTSIRFGSRGSR